MNQSINYQKDTIISEKFKCISEIKNKLSKRQLLPFNNKYRPNFRISPALP